MTRVAMLLSIEHTHTTCPLPFVANTAAEVCGGWVIEIAYSASCMVACNTEYAANSATAACSLGMLAAFTCDRSPCPLPSVKDAAAEVFGIEVTEIAHSA